MPQTAACRAAADGDVVAVQAMAKQVNLVHGKIRDYIPRPAVADANDTFCDKFPSWIVRVCCMNSG